MKWEILNSGCSWDRSPSRSLKPGLQDLGVLHYNGLFVPVNTNFSFPKITLKNSIELGIGARCATDAVGPEEGPREIATRTEVLRLGEGMNAADLKSRNT
jgi:hypothetical protein